jgi:hypothetical protein
VLHIGEQTDAADAEFGIFFISLYLYFLFFLIYRKRSSVASERQKGFGCNQLRLTESFRFIVGVRQRCSPLDISFSSAPWRYYSSPVLHPVVAALIGLALVQTHPLAPNQSSAAGPISVCDLAKPGPILGKLITIKARMLFTMHGSYLLGDSCPSKDVFDVAVLWPGADNAPQVPFDADSQAARMLGPFFVGPIDHPKNACATLTGQVFYKRFFHLHHFGGGPQGNGFGSRGALRRGFVIQTIKEIHPC